MFMVVFLKNLCHCESGLLLQRNLSFFVMILPLYILKSSIFSQLESFPSFLKIQETFSKNLKPSQFLNCLAQHEIISKQIMDVYNMASSKSLSLFWFLIRNLMISHPKIS